VDPSPTAIENWSRLHTAFHDALVSACDNPWLLRMHRMLHEQSDRYRQLALMLNAGLEEPLRQGLERDTTAEHRELLEAALARDTDRMNELMAAHLRRTEIHLLTQLHLGGLVESPVVEERLSKAG
jgi:DNA-binding GntR family transcriptional regulator